MAGIQDPTERACALVQSAQAEQDNYSARINCQHLVQRFKASQKSEFPASHSSKGHSEIHDLYANVERLHATVARRLVMGDTVVDHEQRRLILRGQPGTYEAIAIYEIFDGKIGRLTLVRGAKKLRE
jgi:hypothetical protein